MVHCDHCSGPSGDQQTTSCCWSKALEIREFKKFVMQKYILEVVFDLLVSAMSVVTDIISLFLYIKKGHWTIAVVTAIPVLLPTLVFTNVYMADETQGYCKLPPKKGVPQRIPTPNSEEKNGSDASIPDSGSISISLPESNISDREDFKKKVIKIKSRMRFHCPGCRVWCRSCSGCWSGLFHSIFHKDQQLRKKGVQSIRKSLKRLSKYFFGTFVLRLIALAWYFKALAFGIKAFREPKRYLKIEKPNAHWSYDLLIRLDFLTAALENAPQVIIQLFVLLTYPDENVALGILTLIFSFVDFVRVSVSVQWDIHRGPVIAPSGCYGSITWKLINCCSWVFLYIGRSCAIALVIGTSKIGSWSIVIPIIILVGHVILFTKLFSQTKYGVAAQKIFVSVFISIFFLPEFFSDQLPALVQFYYAIIHIQNIIFITPFNGLDYQYCFNKTIVKSRPKPPTPIPKYELNNAYIEERNQTDGSLVSSLFMSKSFFDDSGKKNDCLIDPIVIVPALTMVGIIMRLAASKRMAKFKQSLPKQQDKMVMEERVAKLYKAKWSQMTMKHLASAFLRMLKKEVLINDDQDKNKEEEPPIYFISSTLDREFRTSQSFIREAVAFLTSPSVIMPKTQRSMSVDEHAIKRGRSQFGKNKNDAKDEPDDALITLQRLVRSHSHDNITLSQILEDDITNDKLEVMNDTIQVVRVDGPNGPYFLETSWI